MTTRIRFLGVAGYDIDGPLGRVLIDPFLTGNPLAPSSPEELDAPDVILVTHGAADHLGDAIQIAHRTGAPLVCGVDVGRLAESMGLPLAQICVTVPGVQYGLAGITVVPVESRHWSTSRLPDGATVSGPALGYIVEMESGIRIYHSGDTALFDMTLIGRFHRPTVGLIGCSQPFELPEPGAGELLTGEMTPQEAAECARMLDVRLAVASHYLTQNAQTAEFTAAVRGDGVASMALDVDDTLVVDGELRFYIRAGQPVAS